MQGRRPPCLALLRFSWGGGGVALGGHDIFVATAVVMSVCGAGIGRVLGDKR